VRVVAVHLAPLLLVLAAGLVLRLYLLAIYNPVAGVFRDSLDYLSTSGGDAFRDPLRPPGYPVFLRILRYAVPDLSFVVVVQHLLGLLTGALLYFCVRYITGRRWLAAFPAAVVVLSGDQLMLEHSLLTEPLYTFLATAALSGIIIGVTRPRSVPLLVASGVALGAAATVRTVAVPLIALVAVWMLVFSAGPLRRRLAKTAWALGPAAAIVLAYIVLQALSTGHWGPSQAAGWALYTRVAPFADCSEFKPPEGTEFLCEATPSIGETPASGRPGPGYYQFVGGPSIERFGNPITTGRLRGTSTLEKFATAVLIHQPLGYAREVGRDMIRYLVPTAGYDRVYAGASAEELDIARRAPDFERLTIERAEKVGFAADPIEVGEGAQALEDFQHALRIHGLTLAALIALAAIALVVGRGTVRRAALLLGSAAVCQALVPVASISWGFRYGVPTIGVLAAAAALGIHACLERAGHSSC
jgi:hypothetical protein